MHHRYDATRVRILEQDGARIRVAAQARGDVDDMGIPEWSVDDWLSFDCIYVQRSDVDTLDAATARLSEVSDISGLTGEPGSVAFRFAPAT